MRSSIHWTEPYYGVQHMRGHSELDGGPRSRRSYQVTVQAHETTGAADWCVLALLSSRPFTAFREGYALSPELARAEAEAAFAAVIGSAL